MISENDLWKKELLKSADKLLKRMIQSRWSKRSIFTLEKELFLGFYSIRKLMEAKSISKEIVKKKYELIMFPKNNELNENSPYDPKRTKISFTVRDICNLFIHSYHFTFFGDKNLLAGFLINSDFTKKDGIYLILIFDIVEIYRLCAGKEGYADYTN